jgi:hypothetical protein
LSPVRLHGSCVCGAVAFEVEEPFATFAYCHCSRCRKKTGSAHAANALVPAASFFWTRGQERVRKFDLEGTRWSSAFCETCGSSLPFVNRTGAMFVVPAGSLEGALGEKPRCNIHFASRAPWYEHASALPTFDEIPKVLLDRVRTDS